MPSFNAEGLSYAAACRLIDALKADGIESSITVGRVRVYPDKGTQAKAEEICKAAGAYISTGLTLSQELAIHPFHPEEE